jgi:hypothetical protein
MVVIFGMAQMTKPSRIDGIDFWRGFALISIFINHSPENLLNLVTHRNFGFSDAAELFVFLSGVSVMLAYGARFLDGRVWEATKAVLRRVHKLYLVQILISLLAIAFLGACTIFLDRHELMDGDDYAALMQNPLTGIGAIMTLSHQLQYFNILPLYVVLLLAAPVLLALARRDPRLMLLASAGIYGLVRVFEINLPTWPTGGVWFFNPLAWQLLFAIGLAVGIGLRDGTVLADRGLFAASVIFVAFCVYAVTNGLTLVPGLWSAKTDLGLVRLMHFLALAYAVYYSGLTRLIARTPVYEPLCLLGRHSLPVFATGSLLAVVARVTIDTWAPTVLMTLAVVVAGIAVQYLVACYVAARARNSKASVLVWPGQINRRAGVSRLRHAPDGHGQAI